MRILCVMIPHFSWFCEVLRKPLLKGRPAIVVRSAGSCKLVLDGSPVLEDLQKNMTLQQALARYGQAELISADLSYYRSVFTRLLDALEEVSPLVEGAEPGCVYIGVNGLQLIYPDDDVLVTAVFDVISKAFKPRIGIGGNKFMAYMAALRCPSGEYRVISGDTGSFLNNLSCDVLPISMKNREKLHSFGIHTLGQIAALPVGPLLSQFGAEGKKIGELARGIDDTPIYPRMMAEVIEENATLVSVTVSLEAILVSLEALLDRIFQRISRAGLGISSLDVWTRTWNSEQWERTIRFKEPAMDVRTTVKRIRLMFEEYPQPGPIEQLGIRINRLGYPRGRQNNLFREVRAKNHLKEDIHQLELRLGAPQVYQVKEVEPWSRIPERRFVLAPTIR